MAGSEPSKYAHFESVKPSSLPDLYIRHGEVARDIHQDILRQFTGNNALTVDLVRESPLMPQENTVEKLTQYDVVSVSTEIGFGGILHSTGMADAKNVELYKQRFAEEDMPVYVVAAGNNGQTEQRGQQRVADFARNSLVVGEAHNGDGTPYIEDHSSRINPTLASDNPFNRGEKYRCFDTSPSLEGHEDLIEKWIIDKEIDKVFTEFENSEAGANLDGDALGKAYWDTWESVTKKFAENEEMRTNLQEQVAGFMAKPETLHALVMADIRETKNVDENGFTSDLDGTSFSAPEQAGYVSGAMYEQEQREDKNLPILTKEEITTLAKMATIDTQIREGVDDPMYSHTNDDGHQFVAGAGHGVFQPEMFRALLDESYKRIETDPDIDRDPVVTVMSAEIGENQKGDQSITMHSNLPEGTNMVIDRVRIDMKYDVDGKVPHSASLKMPDEEIRGLSLQTSANESEMMSWSRIEHSFGEEYKSDENWDIKLHNGNDATVSEAQITIYGYNQGGLMDQMIDYSKELSAKMAPQPDVTPDVENVIPDVPATGNDELNNPSRLGM